MKMWCERCKTNRNFTWAHRYNLNFHCSRCDTYVKQFSPPKKGV